MGVDSPFVDCQLLDSLNLWEEIVLSSSGFELLKLPPDDRGVKLKKWDPY